jgi:hypothetical protein
MRESTSEVEVFTPSHGIMMKTPASTGDLELNMEYEPQWWGVTLYSLHPQSFAFVRCDGKACGKISTKSGWYGHRHKNDLHKAIEHNLR